MKNLKAKGITVQYDQNNNNNNPVSPVDASNGYYGPRRGGGSVGPVPGARNPEIGTIESSPRTSPAAGRNVATERGSRIPSTSQGTTGTDMPRYAPSVQGAGRYPTSESSRISGRSSRFLITKSYNICNSLSN